MANLKTDNGPNGLRNNFERAMSHLLPYDPVAKKGATCIKRGSALISLAEVHDGPNMTIAANDSKPSIGKTGVHLRYHKPHEYKKLTHEQCHELSEWRQDNPDAHKPTLVKKPSHAKKPRITGGPFKSMQISMLVSQQVAAEMKKYNPSVHVSSTNTDGKASADDEKHLMAMVSLLFPSILLLLPTSLIRSDDLLLFNLHPTGEKFLNRLTKSTTSQPEGVRQYPTSTH